MEDIKTNFRLLNSILVKLGVVEDDLVEVRRKINNVEQVLADITETISCQRASHLILPDRPMGASPSK